LAREGTSWASLRFTPPFELALEMAAPFLVERGFDPVPDGLGPALIVRLLLDLPGSTATYFRPVLRQNCVRVAWRRSVPLGQAQPTRGDCSAVGPKQGSRHPQGIGPRCVKR
jgi:hypothetical protein